MNINFVNYCCNLHNHKLAFTILHNTIVFVIIVVSNIHKLAIPILHNSIVIITCAVNMDVSLNVKFSLFKTQSAR